MSSRGWLPWAQVRADRADTGLRLGQDFGRPSPRHAVCQAVTFLNQERFNDYGPEVETPLTDEQRAVLARHSGDGQGGTVLDVVTLHAGKTGER